MRSQRFAVDSLVVPVSHSPRWLTEGNPWGEGGIVGQAWARVCLSFSWLSSPSSACIGCLCFGYFADSSGKQHDRKKKRPAVRVPICQRACKGGVEWIIKPWQRFCKRFEPARVTAERVLGSEQAGGTRSSASFPYRFSRIYSHLTKRQQRCLQTLDVGGHA